eukprot:scaffold427_cov263-Pinguiococcus_pyrenoidosus.AAC.9
MIAYDLLNVHGEATHSMPIEGVWSGHDNGQCNYVLPAILSVFLLVHDVRQANVLRTAIIRAVAKVGVVILCVNQGRVFLVSTSEGSSTCLLVVPFEPLQAALKSPMRSSAGA